MGAGHFYVCSTKIGCFRKRALRRPQTSFLRNAGLRAGALVAIQGVGGLGHLGIQYARRMGFKTVAIGLGRESEKLAKELGAYEYVDSGAEDSGTKLRALGGADAILATAPSGKAMSALISGLAARGKLLVIGIALGPTGSEYRFPRFWHAVYRGADYRQRAGRTGNGGVLLT
jgi:D-arabinose 1-dehydrogenase-like Zn-dependent alcohol dehydrogenase